MNLGYLRDALWTATDQAPAGSDEAVRRANSFINRAVNFISTDAPFLFFKEERTIYLEPDIEPEPPDPMGILDTWTVNAGDQWVLDYTPSAVSALYIKFSSLERPLDARVVVFKDPSDSDNVIERRIRTSWIDKTVSPNTFHIALEKPLNMLSTESIADWRIVYSEYALPPEIIEIDSIVLRQDDVEYPVRMFGPGEAEEALIARRSSINTSLGTPRVAWRQEHQALRNPKLKPATATTSGTWVVATSPVGLYEYVYTYGWGFRAAEVPYSTPLTMGATGFEPSQRSRPYFESAESPCSDARSVVVGQNIVVQLPNLDKQWGFNDAATPRHLRQGWRKYIYRRLLQNNDAIPDIETSDQFQLIASVPSGTTVFTDDGSYLPDPSAPLHFHNGHRSLAFFPQADSRYPAMIRCSVRGAPLVDDQDTPPMHHETENVIIALASKMFFKSAGNASMAADAEVDYQNALHAAKRRMSSDRRKGRAPRKRVARVRRRGGRNSQWPLVSDSTFT